MPGTTCKLLLISALLLSGAVFAKQSDYSEPINVVSREQLADFNANKLIFEGDVEATQGTMKITADKVEITRKADGQLESIMAYGSPVTFYQILDNGKPIHSNSQTLTYLPDDSLVVISGRATIWQGESRMNGERIEYNIKTQRMRAQNRPQQGGRVSSTFVPSELQANGE